MTLNSALRKMAEVIMNSPVPEETARIVADVLYRRADGESMESIVASYGLDWEEIKGGTSNGTV